MVLPALLLTAGAHADKLRDKSSLLNDDPEVVYAEEFTDKKIEFLVVKRATVFSTRKGGRKLGILKVDSKVSFIGMTEKAYKIRGTAIHGGVSGWVSPRLLGSKDKDFVENLKKVYERQKVVRELIAKHEVAHNEGTMASNGTFAVETGEFTGRSPKDKYTVEQSPSKEHMWW